MPTTRKQSAGRNEFSLFKQPRSPFYTVRLMHQGKRRKFSTGETSLAAARRKATAIVADIKSRGFTEAVNLHSRRSDMRSADPDIKEFAALYREVMARCETPPTKPTVEYYIRSLEMVCRHAGVTRLHQLNRTKIDQFVQHYQEQALKEEGRQLDSVRTSINSWLRNAASMFSRQALEGYARLGLTLENPFLGAKLRRVKIRGYTPLSQTTLDRIWTDAVLLRDGDPEAKAPPTRSGWNAHDFRKPQPQAYLLLLLELGLGLRRHEADKAQWDWIMTDAQGHAYLEIRATPYFTPKGKERRVVPMDKALHAVLLAQKIDGIFIVPGHAPRTYPAGKAPKNLTYRCEMHHRALATWLRQRGIVDAKPCHLLRKQFGSYVASSFGLFHAQKFLGHSSPFVTEQYYAGLTNLPQLNSVRIHG